MNKKKLFAEGTISQKILFMIVRVPRRYEANKNTHSNCTRPSGNKYLS